MKTAEHFSTPLAYHVMSRLARVAKIESGSVCPNTKTTQLVVGYSAVNLVPIYEGEEFIAIDGGTDKSARRVNQYLASIDAGIGRGPKKISRRYVTHAHWDHLGEPKAAASESLETAIYVSEEDGLVITGAKRSEGLIPGIGDRVVKLVNLVGLTSAASTCHIVGVKPKIMKPNERHELGSTTVTGLLTPGHTSKSMSYEVSTPTGVALFTGDIFDNAKDGSIKLPPLLTSNDMCQARETVQWLADDYAAANPEAIFYPAHSAGISAEQFLKSLLVSRL